MEILKTKELTNFQFQQVNKLWNEEYPVKMKDRLGKLLEGVKNYNHYLIEDDCENILSWAVYFEKDNEIRFSILVDKKQQKRGLGSFLINRLKKDLDVFYGWVIDHDNYKKENGEMYVSPLMFYIKHGFKVVEGELIETDVLKAIKIKREL